MSTPVPQDYFSRYQVGTFDEKDFIAVSTGFQAFFGNPTNGGQTVYSPDANQVDIDIIRANERIAALVPRGAISRSLGSLQKNLRDEQFSSQSRKYPLAKEEGDITGDNLLNRIAGENPYTRLSRIDRLRYHARKIHNECMRRIIRMDEVLAAQSILTGKQDAIIGTTNADLIYDFRRNTTHNITVSSAWSGGAADIMADIEAGCAKGRANGHVMMDGMLLGATAMTSFVSDTTVRALADNRRFTFMSIGDGAVMPPKFQRFIDGGFIFQGTLRTPSGYQLALFTYLDVYTAADGTATKYMPDDKVVLFSSMARCDRYFGPPESLPNNPFKDLLYREYFGFDASAPPMPPKVKAAGGVIAPEAFYCDAYMSSDWQRITMRCQHAPIFATTMTDAFVVLDTEP